MVGVCTTSQHECRHTLSAWSRNHAKMLNTGACHQAGHAASYGPARCAKAGTGGC
jgi:hypothetical protein